MTKFKLVLLLVVILGVSYIQSKAVTLQTSENVISTVVDTDDDLKNWWKNSVFYQIYPRSFKDSDGDGVGDLKGIIEKLDHLKDAGIGAAWLSPVFASPMKDFGYDVSDFYTVDPLFGSNDDLMDLLEKAHNLGIKLILDFVPNHTSDQHDWFKQSVKKITPYTDYYVWHDGIFREGQVVPDPPNNWLSVFSGPAWTWNEERQQFYLHQFTPEQPDLNFRNLDVQHEMFDVIKYWIMQGFDGFRIDAINHMFETEDMSQNEPIMNPPVTDNKNDYEYLEHTLTRDLVETYAIVREWRKWIDEYNAENPDQSAKVLLTEVYADFDLTMAWYGTEDEPISHIPFNFDFIMDLTPESTVEQIKEVVDRKIESVPVFGLPNWVMGNHDRNRVASRYSPLQVDAINIIALTLPGIAVTYYGEEIGMEDNQDITWEETVDPRACQTQDPEHYRALSRDPVRTPFQWNNADFAGFSTSMTWLPVHPDYENNNLKAQTYATESHFKVYQRLTRLRQESEFRIGGYESIAANNIFSYKRFLNDNTGYIVAVNFKDVQSSIEFSDFSLPSDATGQIVVSSTQSTKSVDSIVSTKSVILEPYEAIVIYYKENPPKPVDPDWWKKSIFYQIYPRSFKDSNDDGVGDLKGITGNLEHLQDAGVGAVWLSPIFKSPMRDMGYDIEDYLTVDPLFGSNEDLIELLEKAHELGLKLILDLVPNHTSDKHEWFQKSIEKDDFYKDFYIWDAGTVNEDDPELPGAPPNNWLSVFSGSAWTWNIDRKEFYLHQFFKEQPDLNFRNPNVRDAMFDVLKHYVNLGFDGFRIDAINYVYEHPNLLDELPRDPPITSDNTAHDYLDHKYTKDSDENYGLVAEWRKWIDEYNALHPGETPKVLLTEAYSTFDQNLKWYGDEDTPIAHIPFNFDLITDVDITTGVTKIKDIIDTRINAIPSFGVPNWVLGNHDNSRVASRYSTDHIDPLNMLVMTLPGIAVTYYGEEIGMEDYDGLRLGDERDPERTPFQWDNTLHAGFSKKIDSTWLPVHPDYENNNLEIQKSATTSHYKTYQFLSKLRQKEEFLYGAYESVAENDVLLYKRYLVSYSGFAVAINFGPTSRTIPFSKLNPPSQPSAILVAVSQGSTRELNTEIDPFNLELAPYEAIVFSYTSNPRTDPPSETPDPDWWKKTVFYQIYPRSFKDSDGNGVGDLQGIIDNLNHFNDAGIGAVWLSPVFSSPMKDFGYDIKDFYEVDPIFGTKDDLIRLLEQARKLGIKVILDFVPNHTSDQHEWFQKSVQREGIYTDFYIWHDGIDNGTHINPPNNWLSVFSGSAWSWKPERQQYYLRQFTPDQPDLNFRNARVQEEIFNVLKYWIEVGFDGFRIDAINHMYEVEDLSLNEPIVTPVTTNPEDYEYLDHIYTRDLAETYAIVREWRKWVDEYSAAHPEYPTKVLLTEVYTDFEKTMLWYGTADEPISHIPFNFDLIMELDPTTTVDTIKQILDRKIKESLLRGLPNWVLGNHDRNRVASRFTSDQVDGLNMLVMTLPGIAVTYYGEEIGMEDNQDITWEETVDPRACQTQDPEQYQALSRDPVRTPFQWDDTKNAGFSTSENGTWLPIHQNYLNLNLKAQKEATTSHFKLYQQLTELRQETEFLNGNYKSIAANNIFAFKREILSNQGYGVAINFGNAKNTIQFKDIELPINPIAEIVAVSGNSLRNIGSSLNPESFELAAYEAIIFHFKSTIPTIPDPSEESDPDWWKKTVFYQIYPRSFKDSDGNGVGDLQGIIDSLEHFIDAGVGAVWLSPVFASPMKDFGYDIKDFYDVDPEFGTKDDLIQLLTKARELGIKVILDFVPNHTSNEHIWFEKSINRDGIFTDFYVWQDGKPSGQEIPDPPNNWLSVFSGSAWTWNSKRQQYYLHQFTPEQPDLNFRNPLVLEEMFNIIKYWVEMGFDGFRVDAINHMFEVSDYSLDEPILNPAVTTNRNEYEFLEHIYTRDLNETYEVVRMWREWMDEYSKTHPKLPTKILLTEVYADIDLTLRWYGSEAEPISHVPFNFDFIMDITADTTVAEIKEIVDRKIEKVPEHGVPNWVMGNHDRNRVASRFTPQQVDAFNILAMTLPGIAVTYYGEEIGMQDNQRITWEETVDPRACQTNDPENYKLLSRDPVRTPFQWNSNRHAGFSSSTDETWLPVHNDYLYNNLAAQKEASNSHYKIYQTLTALRKNPEFLNGEYKSSAISTTFNYIRRSTGGKTYGIAINFASEAVTIDFTSLLENIGFTNPIGIIQISSVESAKSKDSQHALDSLRLGGYEAIVFEVGSGSSLGTKITISIGLLIAVIILKLVLGFGLILVLGQLAFAEQSWWEHGSFYQIYPRSFKDSDGDGVGDINGVIEKLDYLKELGINGLWLSPIFKSPMADFGYDIADFKEVDSIFGTNEDLENLFNKAKEYGIKIILDFVPNHTSDEHEWFLKSIAGDPKYRDYYVWRDKRGTDTNGKPIPPNNWVSVFYGSAWEWNEQRQQFYLHQFDKGQPDLDYRNPAVVQEMKDVLTFWLDKGADGFRMDAVNHMFEAAGYPDEPRNTWVNDPFDYGYTEKDYTKDQPETFEMVYQWRKLVDDYRKVNSGDEILLMIEAYANVSSTQKFYGNGIVKGGHFPFNFQVMKSAWNVKNLDYPAYELDRVIHAWTDPLRDGEVSNWVLGNHDNARFGTAFGEDRINALHTLSMTLPGVVITYNGEEIGMVDNYDISFEQTQDPQACNKGDRDNYNSMSRDPARTPFQWDSTAFAGFTTGQRGAPWLPINKNYNTLNLNAQKLDVNSVYSYYRRLVELRKDPIFAVGNFRTYVFNNQVMAIERFHATLGSIIVLLNFGGWPETIDLSPMVSNYPEQVEIVLPSPRSTIYSATSQVSKSAVKLNPFESLVLKPYVKALEAKSWWENGLFYQVYPRSFKDSDGNGVGDVKGIIEKLDYLKDLGVTGVWLSPIFKSPMVDNGYDISDFRQVDSTFGTNEDLENLFKKAKELGVKIILDFVPNHTSDQHEWFIKSRARDPKYSDYYVWVDKRGTDSNGKPIPPNNWQSVFYGSAWEWDEGRQQFYLHQFHKAQPDLNFRNAAVAQELKDVMIYWLDKGADGFRCDAVNHMFETEGFPDEPRTWWTDDPNDYGYTDHIHTKDLLETFDMVYSWRKLVDDYRKQKPGDEVILMIEAYANITATQLFYGNGVTIGAHFPFNFKVMHAANNVKYNDNPAWDLDGAIHEWINPLRAHEVSNWLLGNHDNARAASSFGEDRINVLHTMTMTLPGVAITYNGEEIGMVDNYDIPAEVRQDSRDPARTPFQWDASAYAGFSTVSPWLPVNSNYQTLNLAAQTTDLNSYYNFYKRLVALRKEPIFVHGNFRTYVFNNQVLTFERSHPNLGSYIVIMNLGGWPETLNLTPMVNNYPELVEVVLSSPRSISKDGDKVSRVAVKLNPFESLIVKPAW